jgi:hypothetical protein
LGELQVMIVQGDWVKAKFTLRPNLGGIR